MTNPDINIELRGLIIHRICENGEIDLGSLNQFRHKTHSIPLVWFSSEETQEEFLWKLDNLELLFVYESSVIRRYYS
jgi:hypothetical protein